MPLHSYSCPSCDKGFETLVRSGETPACPTCGSTDLVRHLSRIAPEGKSASVIASGRQAAAKEGHFANYSKSETKGKF